MTDFLRTKTFIMIASSLLVVISVAVSLFVFQPWNSEEKAADVPEGYTTEVTAPLVDHTQAQLAQQKPEVAEPLIFAEGECKVALDALRAVFAEYEYGLDSMTDPVATEKLNAALPALSTDCDADTASKFQAQELGPWSLYTAAN